MRATLVAAILLYSAGVALPARTLEFRPVKGSNAEGVIIPAELAKKDVVGYLFNRFWTSTDQDIRQLEMRLPKFLKEEATRRAQDRDKNEPIEVGRNLRTSARQYAGVFWRGRRCIFVNGFPSRESDWKRQFVEVSDGGSAFWRVVYDVDRKTFEELSVNGVG
jgi:hypothetical protein